MDNATADAVREGAMKRIIEIVPARPGWYARWRLAPQVTRAYPVTVWALVEETDAATREVVGVDSVGQWPGADDNEAGDFVRYVFQPADQGQPDDAHDQEPGVPDAYHQEQGGPESAPATRRWQAVTT